MRISNKVLVKGFMSDLKNNLNNMKKYQEQLSSGKEVRRPSDNPFKVARALELRTSITINERYAKNIDEGLGWLNTTDSAMGLIGDSMQRIRELTVASGNGAFTDTERKAVATEISQLKDHIIQIGNTAYDGRYMFGGDKTETPPFDSTGAYVGSSTSLKREFSQGVVVDNFGVKGDQFKAVFTALDNIVADLTANKDATGRLKEIDVEFNNILKIRADVGASVQRLEAMKSKNEDENFNMTDLLSKTEDIDVAEKVTQSKLMETIYNASLQTGAKIIQPSLMDFLR